MRKLGILAVLLAIIASSSVLVFQYVSQAPQPTEIRLGISVLTSGAWPIFIAHDTGIFQKYGLNVSVVTLGSGRNVVIALAAGQIDIAQADSTNIVPARLEGVDIVQVASLERARPFYLVTRPEILSVQDLKGKIGGVIDIGTGLTYITTAAMLRRLGLDPTKDVTLVGISGGSTARLAALEAGKIDFTLVSDVQRARELGLNILFYVPDSVEGMPGAGIAVSTTFLKENREIVKRFIKAVTESTKFFFENEEESKTILGKWLEDNDPEHLEQNYADWARVALKIPATSLEVVRNVLQEITLFNPNAAGAGPTIFVDNSVIEELGTEGFFEIVWGP